jgi:hypothetical protein
VARSREKKIPLPTQLGLLAMRFRATRDEDKRGEIAAEYEQAVLALIETGRWKEMPAFEDMLPDEHMPEAFFNFWSIPVPSGHGERERRRRRAD